ncbi:hypothetical protein [Sphingomonas insulae]|uniref:hypothetical protein n=1 Tax=Sphingomonas insulae TaxID=424800 RepID=UPI0013D898D3|nr:hypothetical protein [Sphingomonas insulae]
MKRRSLTLLLAVTLPFCDVVAGVAQAEKIKYAKTEVEKARGKCVGSVLGGALLGALVGRATGKSGLAAGAAIGAAAGAGVCALILANAKRADRIIAAQIASANYQNATYRTTFAADDGTSETTFEGRAGASESIDAVRLQPVRYMLLDGAKMESPVLAGAGQDCRPISGTLGGRTTFVRRCLPSTSAARLMATTSRMACRWLTAARARRLLEEEAEDLA